jgi:hypothetical protein
MKRAAWLIPIVLTCVSQYAIAENSTPDGMAVKSRLLSLLLSGALDDQLEILPAQRGKLQDLARSRTEIQREEFKRYSANKASRGPTGPQSLREVAAAADEQVIGKIADILLPHQQQRWRQVGLQLIYETDRAPAMLASEMQESLRLSAHQSEELNRIYQEGEKERREAEAAIRKRREERMLEVLNEEQRAKWRDAFGEPLRKGQPAASR